LDYSGKGGCRRNHFQNNESKKPSHVGAYGPWGHENQRGTQTHPKNVDSRKLILRDPKSGNETEVVFIPQKVADRLKEYIKPILYEKQTESGETPNHQFRMFELIMEGWSHLAKLSSTI